jgi:flagellar biosynthesis GTPase FlhF
LCKWLSQAALVEGRLARVWRLDGATANLAQNLSVYCEVLAVPVDRFWEERDRGAPAGAVLAEDIGLIDLPGVDWRDSVAIAQLGEQIKGFGSCQVHLVVNAAYDTAIVLAQIKAFSELPVDDLIVTHLDEEPRRGKLWNLVLGTNYTIRYLGTGQNVPGDFCAASAEAILAEQFR